jgi:hypothetical protein
MAGQGPGAYQIFNGRDLDKAYPQLAGWAPESSLSVELTNFDIGKSDLKPEHKDGIWQHSLKTFEKPFTVAWSFGFYSHTGSTGFNTRLSEQRAEVAMRFARTMRAPGVIIGAWRHTGVAWQKGMKDGETGEMRKVLIAFLAGFPSHDPIGVGPSKKMR